MMTNLQGRKFIGYIYVANLSGRPLVVQIGSGPICAPLKAARKGAAHDCMDAGGRATQGAVAEGGVA